MISKSVEGVWSINVAPHAGAWIEISASLLQSLDGDTSLPMRERGLKSEWR